MKKVLIISLSFLHRDPRVLQQYNALNTENQITTIGYSEINSSTPHFNVTEENTSKKEKAFRLIPLLFNLHKNYEKKEMRGFRINYESIGSSYELIICNDISALPIGYQISKGKIPLWADLHEYSPRQFENYWWWNLTQRSYVNWQARHYLTKCNAITTVCQGLADEYEKQFKVQVDALIFNAPNFEELEPTPVSSTIKLVHHGGGQRHRKLENMIEMMKHLGQGYSLDFYLMSNSKGMTQYINELKELSKKLNVQVQFNDPVPTNLIAKTINKYDIGVFILEPVNFNYLNALPNKFFEFIQARLAIAVTPNPEMKRFVDDYDLGVVSDSFEPRALAEKIQSIEKETLLSYKNNSHKYAEELSAKTDIVKIKTITKQLVNAKN